MGTPSDQATALNTQENTALSTQQSTSGARNKAWASGGDWDRHRTRIAQLYRTGPLREVIRIMESEAGFKATPRMYKNRIHQWGLDKNKKENEMRAIVRKRDHRQRHGKSSVFRVRGEIVEYGDIVRYWERKGVSIDDVIAQRSMSATPDAVVECSTPVPSRPSTPEEFAIPENVIRCVRDYYQGSFDSKTWISEGPRSFCKSVKAHEDAPDYLNSLYNQCLLACRLFTRCKFHEAGRTLIYATASIKMILQVEDPETLSVLFALVMEMARLNRLEIAIAVLRQFADLGKLIMGGCHPLSRVCGWLVSLELFRFQDVLIVCLQSAGDRFEHSLGPMHYTTLNLRLNYARLVDVARDNNEEEAAIHELLSSCVQSLGSSDVRTLECYHALAHQYLSKGDYVAAQRMARDIIQYAQNAEPEWTRTSFHGHGLHSMAQSQYMLGETASAEANLRQAIELRLSGWGANHSMARSLLAELEGWMEEQGNLASAVELREWRYQILSSMEMEEEREMQIASHRS